MPYRSPSTPASRPSLRLSILALLAVWILGPAPGPAQTPQSPQDSEIRVLCYNIHYGQGADGRYDVQRLANVIAAAKADLVALQEVDVGVRRSGRVHQAQELGRLTGMAVRYGPTQHYQGGLYGNAVLSRLPVTDVAIHPLPYTEATPDLVTYPRGAVVVTVKAPGGESLRVVSTHFQHNLAEDRLAEAKAINRLLGGATTPTILAGDMNAVPDSAPIAELRKHWRDPGGDDAAATAPAIDPQRRIDYIFVAPAAAFQTVEYRVIEETAASDHRPVLAVFRLQPR